MDSKHLWTLAACAATVGLVACTGLPTGGLVGTNGSAVVTTGTSQVSMTASNGSTYSTQAVTPSAARSGGSPAGVTLNHVWVTFSTLQAHYAAGTDPAMATDATSSASVDGDSTWVTVSTASTTVDLMHLNADTLLGSANLQNGTYTQIRAVVTSASVDTGTDTNPATASLDINGGDLRIIRTFSVKPGFTTTLHFDFDTAHSLNNGGGTWRMRPTAVHCVPTNDASPNATASASPSATSSAHT